MAQFDANINLDVNVNRALAGVNKVEKAVNRLNQGATVDVKVGNLNEAERAAARLYKQLERLENAALSKLPASLQTVIAYLKAASAGMGELASRAITVAAAMGDIGRVNFAPLVRQLNQVSDLMFEIERVTVKFFNNPRNFRPRIEGGNPFQKLLDGLDYVKVSVDQPFQKILDGLDLVDVRVIQTERLLKGLGDTVKRIGGAGFGGPGGLGPGGPPGPGGPGGPLARRGGSAEPFDLNTLRGLRQLQAALRNLLETTQIGSKRFRDLENSIAELNNEIRDAQLLGQRGGSGINVAGNAARRRRRKRAGGEALTGFAFPLLFGGGPGAALGGALGGGIGGLVSGSFGIGLSLLLSEIGSLFDQLAGKSLKLAKSLLDVENSFTTLSAESLTLSRAREKELKALSESGFSIEASIKAQEDLAEILGNQTVNNLRSAGEAFDQLGREFAETIARLGAALDQSGILKFVNDRFAEFNQKAALSSDVFAAQKVAREQGTAADRRLGNSIVNQFLQEGTAAEEEIRTRLAKLADSLPAINVKLNIPTSEQLKIEEQIEGIQVQLNLVGNQQALFGFIEKFSKQADDTARKRERAAQEVKRAEEQIADLRLSLERQVEDLRLSALREAARLEDARADTLGAKLRNELKAAGLELQRSLDFDDPARDLQIGLQQALSEYQVRLFDIQAQEEKLRRDSYLREEQLRLRTQRIIADAEKAISNLKVKTAEQVKEINKETAKLQTDAARSAFELDKKAALLQISLIEKQAKLERVRQKSLEDFETTYKPLLDDIDKAVKESRNIVNNSKFEDVVPGAATGSGGGTSNAVANVRGSIDDVLADIESINARIKDLGIAIDEEISEKFKQDAISAFLDFKQKVIQLTGSVEQLEGPLKGRLQTLQDSARAEALLREGFKSSDVGAISRGIAEFEQLEQTLRSNIAALERYKDIARLALGAEQYATLEEGIDQVLERIGQRLDGLPEKVEAFLASFDKDDPIGDYIKDLNDQLSNTDQIIVDVASNIQGVLASSISSTVSGLVEGTKTVEESVAEMFAGISKAFLDMAAQILSQQLVLTILKAFTSSASGGMDFNIAPSAEALIDVADQNSSFFGGSLREFAKGGYTGSGPAAGGVDGKGGFPAILHPDEYVVPNISRMRGGAGGDNTVVNITVNSNGTTNQSASGRDAEEAAQLGRLIERSTLAIINREKRPGGTLSR